MSYVANSKSISPGPLLVCTSPGIDHVRFCKLLTLIPPALLAYEYVLTLQDEWELVWSRRMASASWMFLANRTILAAFVIEFAFASSESVSTDLDTVVVRVQLMPEF